jgi:UDP-glucose:glycoprotein glucosyltransferase
MKGIGILATQLVSESDTPLETLRQLVHDFPKYATSLSRRVVPQLGLLQEVASNSRKIQPGLSAVWLNGAQLSPDDMNPHRYSFYFSHHTQAIFITREVFSV